MLGECAFLGNYAMLAGKQALALLKEAQAGSLKDAAAVSSGFVRKDRDLFDSQSAIRGFVVPATMRSPSRRV